MKSKLFILLSVMCIAFIGCSERNTPPYPSGGSNSGGSTTSYGLIQFVNNNSDPYKVVVKGNTPLSFTLPKNTYTTKTVQAGYYKITVTQQSGYIFYPTEKEFECYVNSDENQMVSF